MSHPNLAVVTGAFGYTGRHVARASARPGHPREDPHPPPGPGERLWRPG